MCTSTISTTWDSQSASSLGRSGRANRNRLHFSAESDRLLLLYGEGYAFWIVVSNEVGLGVIPVNKLARNYADELGRVNQIFAAAADDVIMTGAGLPVNIRASSGEGKGC